MKTALSILLAFALPLACGSSAAAEKQGFWTWGRSNTTCGSYVFALEEHGPRTGREYRGTFYGTPSAMNAQWIAGFLSGANYVAHANGRPPIKYSGDTDGITLWVKQWCEKNPTRNITAAAIAFIKAHK